MNDIYDEEQMMDFDEFVRFLETDAEQFVDELENSNIDPKGKLQHVWVRDLGDTLLWDKKPREVYIYNRLFKFKRSTDPKKAKVSVDTDDPVLIFKDTPRFDKIQYVAFAPALILALDPDRDYRTINYLCDLVSVFVFFYRRLEDIDEAINEFMRTAKLCEQYVKERGTYLAPELMNYLYTEFYLKETPKSEGGD